MENTYSPNHEASESKELYPITPDALLRRMVSVCLLAGLVQKKMDYGEELLKRVLEIKVGMELG